MKAIMTRDKDRDGDIDIHKGFLRPTKINCNVWCSGNLIGPRSPSQFKKMFPGVSLPPKGSCTEIELTMEIKVVKK